MQGVRDYLKFLKRGYGRIAHLTSIDIRNGRLDRDTALRLTQKHDGRRPASLDLFLEYLGLTDDELLEIAREHIVSPWQPEPASMPDGAPLHDMADWDPTVSFVPVESLRSRVVSIR